MANDIQTPGRVTSGATVEILSNSPYLQRPDSIIIATPSQQVTIPQTGPRMRTKEELLEFLGNEARIRPARTQSEIIDMLTPEQK